MAIQVKLSAKSQAVTLKNLSKEHAHEITKLLIGVEGITRITTEWDPDQEQPEQPVQVGDITYPEKECQIISEPREIQSTTQEVPQEEDDPETLFILFERPRVHKNDLGPYISIGAIGIGYHDQPGDFVVICKGTTKVYTTIGDMERLQFPVNPDELVNLNPAKQAAVRAFKQWVETDYKDHLKKTQNDQDADFKNQLPPGMIDTGTASIDSSKHEGPMPE